MTLENNDKKKKLAELPQAREIILAQAKIELQLLQSDVRNPQDLTRVERQKIKQITHQELQQQLAGQGNSLVYVEGWHIVTFSEEKVRWHKNLLKIVQALLPGKVDCMRVEIPTQKDYQKFERDFHTEEKSAIQFLYRSNGKTEPVKLWGTPKDLWERAARHFEMDKETEEKGRRLAAHFELRVFREYNDSLTARIKYDPNSPTFLAYYVPSLQKSFAVQTPPGSNMRLLDEKGGSFGIPAYAEHSVESVDQEILKRFKSE